jgi:O-antigen ligase
MIFAFSVPWEYSLDIGEPYGNIARVVGLLLLALTVAEFVMDRSLRSPGIVQWLVLSFYLYFACTYFWTAEADVTLEKMRAYFQVMMIVWIVWEVGNTPAELRGLFRAFVAGCWVLAVLTVIDFISADQALNQIRFMASGQDPNDVARFLDIGFPIAALLFATEKNWAIRALALVYIPAGLMAVLLTASRGGFSAALVALFGVTILLVLWKPQGASLTFVGLAITAAALLLFVPIGSIDRLATLPQEAAAGDWNDRLNIWNAGWHAFLHAPWWGYGAGTFTSASGLASGDTAHNTLLAVLVTGGLCGIIIYAAILIAVCWSISRTSGILRVALATALTSWGISSMVGTVEENRVTWLLFGMMAFAGRVSLESPGFATQEFSGRTAKETRIPALAGG